MLVVEVILQFLATDEFHDQIGDIGLVAEIEHRNDVRMVQARHGLCFQDETRRIFVGQLHVVQLAFQDGLDGDLAIELRIDALVHDPHGATPEHAHQFISSEKFSWLLHPVMYFAVWSTLG